MIPKYQRILFWTLNLAILIMALVLLRGCEQTREKLTRRRDQTPLAAPVDTPSETVRLAVANDTSGAITMMEREVALPAESTARAKALLGRLIAEYSFKNSNHPIESGPAVDDVFLLDLPLQPAVGIGLKPAEKSGKTPRQGMALDAASGSTMTDDAAAIPHAPGGQLAVVNLHGTFADHHPSGIEAETLTLDSMIGTLYANFPRVEQVRFLVDGQPRETLNGHADLMQIYRVVDTSTKADQGVR